MSNGVRKLVLFQSKLRVFSVHGSVFKSIAKAGLARENSTPETSLKNPKTHKKTVELGKKKVFFDNPKLKKKLVY